MEMSFRYRFEAAHRFTQGATKCSTPHGHTWWINLSLSHSVHLIKSDTNFSWDFADLKKEWKSFVDGCLDHSFICNEKDPLLEPLLKINSESRILKTPGDPTTEILAILFLKKARTLFKKFEGVEVLKLTLEETPTNSISLSSKDLNEISKDYLNKDNMWWNSEDPLVR